MSIDDSPFLPNPSSQQGSLVFPPESFQLLPHQSRSPSSFGSKSLAAHPTADKQQQSTSRLSSFKARFFKGRSNSLRWALITMVLVTFFNIAATIILAAILGTHDGVVTLITDSDNGSTVPLWDKILHLLINILSTALLWASGVFLQLIASPTRYEVDQAHARHRWYDIGISTWRNVRQMPTSRKISWFVLCISALPIHLFYNSVIYTEVTTHAYVWALVTPDFLNGAPFDVSATPFSDTSFDPFSNTTGNGDLTALIASIQANHSTYQRLDPKSCIEAYQPEILVDRSNVILVSENAFNATNSLLNLDVVALYNDGSGDINTWLCPQIDGTDPSACDYDELVANADNWVVDDHSVSYCLSQRMPPHSTLKFSLSIMAAVLVANIVKLLVIVAVYRCMGDFLTEALLVPGDMLQSFLLRPGTGTEGGGLWGDREFAARWPTPLFSRAYHLLKRRHYQSASKSLWATAFILTVLTTALSVLGGLYGLVVKAGHPDLLQSGFGSDETFYIIFLFSSAIPTATASLVSNLPQLLVAGLFLCYTTIFRRFTFGSEWFDYGRKFVPLRVSTPSRLPGSVQTSSSGLPASLGGLNLILSVLLHWLASQSLYPMTAVTIDEYGNSVGTDYGGFFYISNCAYSSSALITFGVAVLLTFVVVVSWACRAYPRTGMPLTTTNSAALSAATQAAGTDPFARVGWGLTGAAWPDGAQQCGFVNPSTSEEVAPDLPAEASLCG